MVIKGGGLPGCSGKKEGVINSVVERGSSDAGLVVYRREEGEETMNTMHNDA